MQTQQIIETVTETAIATTPNIEHALGWMLDEGERIDARDWATWQAVKKDWLQDKRERSGRNHTANAYRLAYDQFFAWAAISFGVTVPPWAVTVPMAQSWDKWLRTGAKVIAKNVDAAGAPWDGPGRAGLPDWMLWDDPESGRLISRQVKNGQAQICERGPLAKSSVNIKLSALTSFYTYVRRHAQIIAPGSRRPVRIWPDDKGNPFDAELVERRQIQPFSNIPPFPSTPELRRILAAINTNCIRGKRDYALLLGLAYTCRRVSEFVELRWGDIESDGDEGYIYSANIRKKKGGSKRVHLVLDTIVYRAIEEYLKATGRLDTIRNDEYIFTSLQPERTVRLHPEMSLEEATRRHIGDGQVNDILRKCCRWAGVDKSKAHAHALRHAGLRWRVQVMKKKRGVVDYEALMLISQHESLDMLYRYSKQVLESPEDGDSHDVAEGLAATGNVYRPAKVVAEQPKLL